jgi:signal transduction histidine kinase/ActR/RegA family two-component response regulator
LHRLRGGKIAAFGTRDGLFDDLVVQILDDGAGSLWMSSNRGVFRVSKSDLEARAAGRIAEVRSTAFGVADGMPSAECHGGSQPAGFRTADGRLWFPTLKGVAIIDPAHVPINTSAPSVMLEEVRVDRRSFDLRGSSTVPPGRRDFEFHYTALSFVAPEKVRFAYHLEGFDAGWIDAGSRRVAYYTRLPPGHYRFRVRAANNDGVWSQDGAGLAFSVSPRFHETRWFPALLAAGLLLLAFAGYRLRTRHLRRRQLELEALVDARTRDLRQAHAKAESARERAEEASQAKTRFLANVSHELRTPLGAILGFVEMMQRRSHEPEEREHLDIIQRSGEHLLALINDVLSISQIEAGGVPLRIAPFELPRLLQGLHEMFGVRATEKGLELSRDQAPDLPQWVRGDEAKVRQVLINLLANAVKFTRSGRVMLRARRRGDLTVFEVEDTGPGIAEDEKDKLFAPFVQGQLGQDQEGTGLGLAISRSYARLMGGELDVESAPGKGAVFRLSVPLPRTEAPARQVEPVALPQLAVPERPLRVLVVDDTAENRLLMARLHALVGLEVKEATDGQEAVELWQSYDPDLIWMDTRMPRMDGPAATREIRRLEAERSREHVPIIAVTAGVLETEETDLLRAGYDAVVAKPFRTDTIFGMLKRHLPPAESAAGAGEGG